MSDSDRKLSLWIVPPGRTLWIGAEEVRVVGDCKAELIVVSDKHIRVAKSRPTSENTEQTTTT